MRVIFVVAPPLMVRDERREALVAPPHDAWEELP